MTCIVGIISDGAVIIGGDSLGTAGQYSIVMKFDKIFRNGPYLIGTAGSVRVSQILHYGLKLPKPPTRNLQRFMCTTFIDTVRQALETGGTKRTKDGIDEVESAFMVGVNGRLFNVDCDFQIVETTLNYDAVGAGRSEALGSLFSTSGMEPEKRVNVALEAAEMFNNTVRRPFVIMRLED